VIASTWLVVRVLTGPAPRPRRPAARPAAPPPTEPRRGRGWRRAMELGGTLMGSALRSGLAPATPKTAAAPLALAAAWRWLQRTRALRR